MIKNRSELKKQDPLWPAIKVALAMFILIQSFRSAVYSLQNPERTRTQVFLHIWLGGK